MRLYYEPEIDRMILRVQAVAKQKMIEHGRHLLSWAQNGLLYMLFRVTAPCVVVYGAAHLPTGLSIRYLGQVCDCGYYK